MQTVLITGANGFLGFYLCQHLLKVGWRVVATGKGPCRLPYTDPGFHYEPLDFTDETAIARVFTQYPVRFVVHAGAITSPDQCENEPHSAWRVNVEGTRHMLAAAASVGAFFLYISTDFVFGGTRDLYQEYDLPDPVNEYGRTKAAAEALVQGYPSPWAIARPILVYGPPQTGKQNLLTMVATALKEGRTLRLFTDQLRLPTFIDDLTLGLGRILEQQATGIFHFCGADPLTPYDIGMQVAAYLQLDTTLILPVTAAEFFQPAARPPRTLFSLDKVHKELAYQPTGFAQGMRKTLEGWQGE